MPIDESAEIDAPLDYAFLRPSDEERRRIWLKTDPYLAACSTARQEWEIITLGLDFGSEISAELRGEAIDREWQENQNKLHAARGMRRLSPDLLPDLRRATAALGEIRREPVAALLARLAREAAQSAAAQTAAAQTAAAAAQSTRVDPQAAALGLATICIEPRIIAQRPIAARVCAGMLH